MTMQDLIDKIIAELDKYGMQAPEEHKAFWRMMKHGIRNLESSKDQIDVLSRLAGLFLDIENQGFQHQADLLKDSLVRYLASLNVK